MDYANSGISEKPESWVDSDEGDFHWNGFSDDSDHGLISDIRFGYDARFLVKISYLNHPEIESGEKHH